jgi:N-acetylmuramoyl-L-alanine amidase
MMCGHVLRISTYYHSFPELMFHLLRKPCCLLFGLAAILSATSLMPLAALAQTSPVEISVPVPKAPSPVPKRPVSNSRPLVVIDPGHGGKDPGAIGLGNLREVDVILPISLRVAAILNKNGVDAKLTRNSDYFVGLDERVVMSRKAGARIFVSIHANSIDGRPDVHGLETYHYHKGEELANIVHNKILDILGQDSVQPLVDRGVRSARFLVLRKSEIPAILVETGYLTSPNESSLLANPSYREKMAQAIAAGILEYLHQGGQLSERIVDYPSNQPGQPIPIQPPNQSQKP